MLLSVGPDLPYFTGYAAPQLERLTMAIVRPDAATVLLVPRLEAMKVADVGAFDIVAWDETEDPLSLVARSLPEAGRAAIGDHTWATFVIGLQQRRPGIELYPASRITSRLRVIKEEAEVAVLAQAAAAADRVAARLGEMRLSGWTEGRLADAVRSMCVEEGHDRAWDPIVGSGPNGASPHHTPGDRTIVPGDTVVVDFGGTVGGYFADTTRTFAVGPPAPEVAEAYSALAAAQQAGVDAVAPGVKAEAVDAAARRVLDDAGYGELFLHRTGHGIGLDIHEDPYIVAGNAELLAAGMVFSVEPGIYRGGAWGMRIEDIVVVTAEGGRRLNQSSRNLVVVA